MNTKKPPLFIALFLILSIVSAGDSRAEVLLKKKTSLFYRNNLDKHKFDESRLYQEIDTNAVDKSSLRKDIGVRNKFIVTYKNEASDKDVSNLKKRGINIKRRYKIIKGISFEIDETNESIIKYILNEIKSDENVEGVFEDKVVRAFLTESIPQINADIVQASGGTGSGVNVCILDTGIDYTHPALPSLIAQYDFINDDSNAMDDNGHGTHVAGIVASSDATYKGVAPGASLIAGKVLDSSGNGTYSSVIAGIEWCINNNADIISMSLGGDAFIDTSYCDSDLLALASNYAVDQGAVVLAASGNDGYTNAISTPACASKTIAVGAVDKDDGRTPYSNEGLTLDLVAPGGKTTGSPLCPRGDKICSTKLGGGFVGMSGTSMATPHVSGVAALMLDKNPTLIPSKVGEILRSSALDLGTVGFDTIYGYGRVDALAAFNATPEPPVSCWNLNENSGNILNDSIRDNNGEIYGASWVEGKIGSALEFDGESSYVDISSVVDDMDLSQDWSVCMWIMDLDCDRIFTFGDSESYEQVGLMTDGGGGESGNLGITTFQKGGGAWGSQLIKGEWIHTCLVWDSSINSELRSYYNGNLDAAKTPTPSVIWSVLDNAIIGAIKNQTGVVGNYRGAIDDVVIYNKALNLLEIQEIYENGLNGISACGL